MRTNSCPRWWSRRRVLLPAGMLLAVLCAVAVAIGQSTSSCVMVCNRSGQEIPELTVNACNQVRSFHQIRDRGSVQLRLAPRGAAGDIAVSTNGVTVWQGEFLEPQGGYRALVCLERNGHVEVHTALSWWRHLHSFLFEP